MKAIEEPFFSVHALPCMTPSIGRQPTREAAHTHRLAPCSPHIHSDISGVVSSSARRMTTEFVRVGKFHQEVVSAKKMEMQPELSLGPRWPALGFASEKSTSSSESDGSSRKKRKHYTWEEPLSHPHLELHLSDPLPLDWEQCLDLQSGRMYYLNRKTLKRSWNRPKEQGVNLELNMSTTTPLNAVVSDGHTDAAAVSQAGSTVARSGLGNMIAVPCANCHLLVMLCKSSPSCPNCKFVQSLAPAIPQAAHRRIIEDTVKPLQTLSLLH